MSSKLNEPLINIVRKLLTSQFLIFVIVIISIILLSSYWGGKREVDQQIYTDTLLSEKVDNYINTAVSDLQTLTYMPPTSNNLKIVGKTNDYFDVLYFINQDGKLAGIYPEDPRFPVGRDMTFTPYYQTRTNGVNITRPFISSKTGNPTVYISLPLQNSKGIVVGELSLFGLQESLIHSQINPSGIFYIVDQDGYLLTNPQYNLVQEHIDIRNSGIFQKAQKDQKVQINLINGKIVLDVVIKNENTKYWAVVEGSIFSIFGPYIFPSVIGLIVTIALLIFLIKKEEKDFSDKIVTPLVDLKNAAQLLSAGDYSTSLIISSKLDTFEEVQSLNKCFNQMRKSIEFREIALAEEKKLLRTLIDNLPDSIYTKDLEGRKTLANPTDVMFCGKLTEADVLGKKDYEIYPPEIAQQFFEADQKVIESGQQIIGLEEQLIGQNGEPIWLITSKIPLIGVDGKIIGLVGVGHDITARKKAEIEIMKLNSELEIRVMKRTEALEEANKELESFSYSVSHDLRAPLRAIDGYSSILLSSYSELLDEKGKQYFNQIRYASQKMGDLIEDLLKLSRISRTQLSIERVDLINLAKKIFDELYVVDRHRKIDIIMPEKIIINADRKLIEIALNNLIRNAWKFTNKCDHGKIEIGSYLEGNITVVFIKDNGAGFNMAFSDKLFGAFQRLHDTSEYEGTGIGLAIVKRIISHHGGRIWAEGKVNEGAIFSFTVE